MAAITPYTIEGLQKDISILNIKLNNMEIWVLSLTATLLFELKKNGTLTDDQIALIQLAKLQKGGKRNSKKKTSKK